VSVLWFLLVALFCGRNAIDIFHWTRVHAAPLAGWAALLSSACMFVFCLTLSWLMAVRRSPRAHAEGILPGAIAFAATYLPWLIPFSTQPSLSRSCRALCPGGPLGERDTRDFRPLSGPLL
jgi:hypothetical protein